jgi:hypothetical protein
MAIVVKNVKEFLNQFPDDMPVFCTLDHSGKYRINVKAHGLLYPLVVPQAGEKIMEGYKGAKRKSS